MIFFVMNLTTLCSRFELPNLSLAGLIFTSSKIPETSRYDTVRRTRVVSCQKSRPKYRLHPITQQLGNVKSPESFLRSWNLSFSIASDFFH